MNFFKRLFGKKTEEKHTEILIDGMDGVNGRPKDDNVPWIKMEWYPMDDGRVRCEMDWTPGFIKLLREQYNYQGSSDDQIAHKFIAEMHAARMEEERGDNSDLI